MTNETLRMQMLAGVITEGEYKAKLQESLWDRIKNTPKAWVAKIKGGTPATMASALSDGGIKIGVPIYAYDGGELNKMTIKSINYNTGISDVIYEKSLDGGKNWKTDEKESLKTKLGLDQDLSSLLKKTPEERKTWYDETVKSIKDNFSTKDMSYRIEDLKPDTPITKEYALENKKRKSLKESMIGGIVGIGAINQIPPREKTDYETAFEHFLGERYENREQDSYTMKEEEVEEGKEVEEPSLYENNPLKGDPGHMTKYRIGVISTLISDAEKDLIKYKEAGLLSPELTEKMKGTIERLKLTLKDLKAQYEEEIKAFSNDGMDKNKKIDDQTYRDQMAAIQGGYY